MNPKSAIQKGKSLENYVADQIVAKGIDPKARRESGSGNGNREKGDVTTSMMVLGQNAGIECKHVQKFNIPEYWRQTRKLESLGREPILVIKQTHDDYADTKAVIYLDTLLELVKKANQAGGVAPIVVASVPREVKWAAENLKRAAADMVKKLSTLTDGDRSV